MNMLFKIAILLSLLLAGCSINDIYTPAEEEKIDNKTNTKSYIINAEPVQTKQEKPSSAVNRYIKFLVQDLVANLDYARNDSVFGVTNFTYAESDLKTAPRYSFHIAESIQHELHMFGINVIEYKSTGALSVTPQGDFFLSRDFKQLKVSAPINYIVTGTVSALNDEVLINAKVVGVESMAVVASAQSSIPSELLSRFEERSTIPTSSNIRVGKE